MSLTGIVHKDVVFASVAFTTVSAIFTYSMRCRQVHTAALKGGRGNHSSHQKDISAAAIIGRIEERVQRDEGKRSIKELILPGELSLAASDCLKARNIVIITGFPCLVDFTPPTETDGPLGALAIARSLLSLGNNKVSLLTDECNEDVMLAATAASGLFEKYRGRFQLESFPAFPSFEESDETRLNRIADNTDLLIAIERTGPSKEGTYLTMRAIDMSHIVAPLDDIISRRKLKGENQHEDEVSLSNRGFRSIGIGGIWFPSCFKSSQ
jgi:hypothetical protein